MKRKRFKTQKDLIRTAIKKIGYVDPTGDQLTDDEKLAKNILILSGIRSPSIELIRKAMQDVEQ